MNHGHKPEMVSEKNIDMIVIVSHRDRYEVVSYKTNGRDSVTENHRIEWCFTNPDLNEQDLSETELESVHFQLVTMESEINAA